MRNFALLFALAGLTGCTVGPDYRTPTLALAPAYHAAVIRVAAAGDWWSTFGDPVLDGLVAKALAQNLDVAAAAARVDEARAAAGGADAAPLPSVNANASADKDRQSLDTPVGVVSRRLGLPRDYAFYQAGAEASWEIDLFGGLRRGREAARADYVGAAADADAVRLSIAAELVDSYLQLRGLQARRDVAERQLETERALIGLIRQRADQGIVSDRELNRVTGEEEGLVAALAPLRAAIVGQIARIDVLVGEQAGTDAAGRALPPYRPRPIHPATPTLPR